MKILYYNDLKYTKVKKQFNRVVSYLEDDNFSSAEVKKMQNTGFYRAKLDYENRLLFKIATFNDDTYIVLLEVIYNHDYEKSRFLRGAIFDESKLLGLNTVEEVTEEHIEKLGFVNSKNNKFHLLDKVISFDDTQQNILKTKTPLVIIGSAGSGKTVLTLEKMKTLKGDVLYITLSSYLVENSAKLYFSDNYENTKQEVDFLNFKEYLESTKIIKGTEVDYVQFNSWLQIRKHAYKIKDTYKLYEEIKGVITGFDITKRYLSRDEYFGLGVKQSIFLKEERKSVYDIFEKYIEFLEKENLYDINIVSHDWLEIIEQKYDFIVIDEVQDFTNIQLFSILKSLKDEDNFVLCGDSNQIVHPNFFSWTNVKRMFYEHSLSKSKISVLKTNYRNSIDVTNISNRLLNIKNSRFGSIDKESTYLIDALEDKHGEVAFYKLDDKIGKSFNSKTVLSTKFAVIVMTDAEKAQARKHFKTPLLFSIHEAKGLEYDNIILLNFISNNHKEFNEIVDGVDSSLIESTEIKFSRAKDKSDKSLDAYKFYINSLYVGFTRAVDNLYILENNKKHELLKLLKLVESKDVNLQQQKSSIDDWKKEARKLELQGKQQQADEIKASILGVEKPTWDVITPDKLEKLKEEALDKNNFNKKAKDKLFAYSLIYNQTEIIDLLIELKYNKARNFDKEFGSLKRKHYYEYSSNKIKSIQNKVDRYGVEFRDEFNLTPLLASIYFGDSTKIKFLLESGAKVDVVDNIGRTPYRLVLKRILQDKGGSFAYNELIPKLKSSSITIKVEDRLVKIANHKMEFFLLQLFMNEQDAIIGDKYEYESDGVKATDITYVVQYYNENILQDFRKKNTYISSILSKNEVSGNSKYNNKIFLRLERGFYIVNPNVEIMNDGNWVNIYELSNMHPFEIQSEEDKFNIANQNFYELLEKSLNENYDFPIAVTEVKKTIKRFEKNKAVDLQDEYRKAVIESKQRAKTSREREAKQKRKHKEEIKRDKEKVKRMKEEKKQQRLEKEERDEKVKEDTQLNLFD